MRKLVDLIGMIAVRRSTVLITGETGCGKEVVARAIHAASPRCLQPFVGVNCAAIPHDMLESELFGHARGAFAGATDHRAGRFEQAEGGTIFLDEIGDLPLDLQGKLLRALQEREYQRLGSSESTQSDVRVLAATNVDLQARLKQGKFREDLYYRLHVVPIVVPPLRDHKSDIPLLATHFIQKIARREGLAPKSLTEDALAHLVSYSWPGNVRQLENALELAMIMSGDRAAIEVSDFAHMREYRDEPVEMGSNHLVKLPEAGLDFEAVISRIELDLLEQALSRTNGNKSLAAELLRLKRTTLSAKLQTLRGPLSRESEPASQAAVDPE
jgi:transcriptional regulator with GAF, ATPase, and Fis domain